MAITRDDVDFVAGLRSRHDWTKMSDDERAPISVGEFRRCLSITAVAIQANIGIIEGMKCTNARLGIKEIGADEEFPKG